jgi:hypothetical protein
LAKTRREYGECGEEAGLMFLHADGNGEDEHQQHLHEITESIDNSGQKEDMDIPIQRSV